MIVVGVTGRYCAGKSAVSEILAEHGYLQIDVDSIGHEALNRERDRVVEAFGDAVTTQDGCIDRKALGRIVFSDSAELRRLEAIVHPAMVEMTAERVGEIREGGGERDEEPVGIVINAAILTRMGLDRLCDAVIYVRAPFCATWRRARERDGASVFEVVKRLRAQRDVDPQHSPSNAETHSVENDGDRERLREQIAACVPLP